MVETGRINVSYRLDQGYRITDWEPLGEFGPTNTRVKLKTADYLNQGYRIQFDITSNTADQLPVLNGFIIEENEAINKEDHHYHGGR